MGIRMPVTVTDSAPDSLSPPVKRQFRRYTFQWAWILLAIPIPVFLSGVNLPMAVSAVPLVLSVVFLGLPHGAVDHLVLPRVRETWSTPGAVRGVVALYAVLGGAYLLWWLIAPVSAAVFFILLTWFHWGQGELFPLIAFADADHLDSLLQRTLTVVVRGGIPMLVPLIGFPETYRRFVEVLVAPFAGNASANLAWLFAAETRVAIGVGFAALTIVTVALAYSLSQDRRAWTVDAFEVALLWVYFLSVPPVFAIGLYFCVWHAARHVARLISVDDPARNAIEHRDISTALVRFGRDAAPTTIAALVLFGGLVAIVPDPPETLLGYTGLYLVLIAVLTLPHVVVVSAMDGYQGIWRRGVSSDAAP